jgi:hypothetical protein
MSDCGSRPCSLLVEPAPKVEYLNAAIVLCQHMGPGYHIIGLWNVPALDWLDFTVDNRGYFGLDLDDHTTFVRF